MQFGSGTERPSWLRSAKVVQCPSFKPSDGRRPEILLRMEYPISALNQPLTVGKSSVPEASVESGLAARNKYESGCHNDMCRRCENTRSRNHARAWSWRWDWDARLSRSSWRWSSGHRFSADLQTSCSTTGKNRRLKSNQIATPDPSSNTEPSRNSVLPPSGTDVAPTSTVLTTTLEWLILRSQFANARRPLSRPDFANGFASGTVVQDDCIRCANCSVIMTTLPAAVMDVDGVAALSTVIVVQSTASARLIP